MSKVFRVSRTAHAAAQIADGGMTPITKTPLRVVGRDATLSAQDVVDTMFKAMAEQAKVWHTIAWQVIDGTTDFRVEVMRLIDARLKELRETNRVAHGIGTDRDAKRWIGQNVNSYAVQVSSMNTIARAFNAGADVDALATHYNVPDPRNMGYVQVVNFARAFLEAKAMADGRGRKADALKVALKKFLDKRAESLASDVDKVNFKRCMSFLDTLQD